MRLSCINAIKQYIIQFMDIMVLCISRATPSILVSIHDTDLSVLPMAFILHGEWCSYLLHFVTFDIGNA